MILTEDRYESHGCAAVPNEMRFVYWRPILMTTQGKTLSGHTSGPARGGMP